MTAKRKEVRFLPVPGMEGGDAGEPRSGFAGLLGCFSGLVAPGPTEYVAIKIHAGEKGNSNFLRPHQVMGVIEGLSLPREQVFLTDTTVLYRGYRMSAPAYVTLAREHGYGLPETPPFLVADGLRGTDDVVVMLPSPCELDSARIARMIADADAMVVVSHFKGHMLAGFGGAIKNLAMGCASRGGKLVQHSSVKPAVRAERCAACGTCATHCPAGAIEAGSGSRAVLNSALCTGCGECLQVCPTGALGVNWNQEAGVFHRRLAEYALAASTALAGRIVFVNFVTAVSPSCDCDPAAPGPMVADLGALASLDPVALDQACFDMVRSAPALPSSSIHEAGRDLSGIDKFALAWPGIDSQLQLEHAQFIGLGSRDYSLVPV